LMPAPEAQPLTGDLAVRLVWRYSLAMSSCELTPWVGPGLLAWFV
jgi:hypothetical protein